MSSARNTTTFGLGAAADAADVDHGPAVAANQPSPTANRCKTDVFIEFLSCHGAT
jgi:hypothetical protein